MYEALAARTDNNNRFPSVTINRSLIKAMSDPLISGIPMANTTVNQPCFQKDFNFFPLVIPMSKRNIAKNPLNKSVVKGLMPSAWASLVIYPISKLPKIRNTLPLNTKQKSTVV